MVREERQRVLRLRTLAADLERLPRSQARDVLLRATRSRVVAVETGEPSRPAYTASHSAQEPGANPADHDLHWVESANFLSHRLGMSL